jgi:PAS domain S-box-containing protein
MACELRVASDRAEYEAALARTCFDLILSDYGLPDYDGLAALALARAKQPDVPFILISGTLGEEQAVDCLLCGATDYVLKQRLGRLVPAMLRALVEAAERQKRRESEARYRALFNGSADGILVADIETKTFKYANPALSRMLGYTEDELRTMGVPDIHPKDAIQSVVAEFETLARGDKTLAMDIPCLRKDGSVVYADINVTRITIDGRLCNAGFFRDITERKRAEEEREQMLRRQQGLSLVQQSLLAPAPLEDKLRSITDSIVRLFGADFCRIWLLRPGDLCERGCVHAGVKGGPHVCRHRDRCLHLLASSGRYTHIDGKAHRRVPFGAYKIGHIASGEDHKFLTNDVTNDPLVHNHEWARELGLVSFAGYQLRIPGAETLGVLALFAKHLILPAQDALLDGLSSTLAEVIQEAQAEDAVRASEEKYRGLFESSRDAIMTSEPPSWRFTSGNPATVKMFGAKNEEELTSHGPWELSPDCQPGGRASAEQSKEMIETALREGSHSFEWTHRRIGGEEFPADVLLTRMEQGGKVILQATVRDITERKQLEEALRESSQFNRQIVTNAQEGIVVYGRDLKYQVWNPFMEHLSGLPAAQVLGKHPDELFPFFRAAGVLAELERALAGETTPAVDFHFEGLPNGKSDWTSDTNGPLRNAAGEIIGVIGIVRDITERKRAEEELRASEIRYRRLFEAAKDGILILDAETGMVKDVNPFLVQLLGISKEAFLGKKVWELGFFKDIVADHDHFKELQEKEYIRYDDKPLKTADGRRMDVEFVSNVYQVNHHSVIQCNIRDMTARKRTEWLGQVCRDQLRALAARIEMMREEERTRISRAIHDELGQMLTGIKMDLRWMEQRLDEFGEDRRVNPILDKLVATAELADATIKVVQRIAAELRPGILDKLGLPITLQYEAGRFEKRTGIACRLVVPGEALPLRLEAATAFFRIFQEALTNVARHAKATAIEAELQPEADGCRLEIRDNGQGMAGVDLKNPKSLGLLGMQERASLLGGGVSFAPRPGGGTVVTVRIPNRPTNA